MNEKIRELVYQSDFIGKKINGDEWRWGYIDPELNSKLEKFAELIVQECATICKDTAEKQFSPLYNRESDGAAVCYKKIKEHFGVE